MKETRPRDRLRLAIDVPNAALAERIASALSEIEGVELVSTEAEPEALVMAASATAPEEESEITLTARELEVLALLFEMRNLSGLFVVERIAADHEYDQGSRRNHGHEHDSPHRWRSVGRCSV